MTNMVSLLLLIRPHLLASQYRELCAGALATRMHEILFKHSFCILYFLSIIAQCKQSNAEHEAKPLFDVFLQ